jgi:predicted amidohydrolase YtcJ
VTIAAASAPIRTLILAASIASPTTFAQAPAPADLVLTNAKIYTASGIRESAHALAIADDHIVFVGTQKDALKWVGPKTIVRHMDGRRILPGLIDSHLHPMDIVDLDSCDLNSQPHTLQEISGIARACIDHYRIPAGGRLLVHQWNFAAGNQPDPEYPTLRAALDKASTAHQIELLGNDGHHGAFNSAALASAKGADGKGIGISKDTLAKEFSGFKKIVGVDARGEPDGAVNEDARLPIDLHAMFNTDLPEVAKAPERITQRLNAAGITGVLDAMTEPESLPVYDALQSHGLLTLRAELAQFYDPERFRKPDGLVDFDKMLASAAAVRSKYASNPLIRADFVKLFADGVLEGNPIAVPPALPNAAALQPYHQPLFSVDKNGVPAVTGYVDTASPPCIQARSESAKYDDPDAAARFSAEHGFYPSQCAISDGRLQHAREVILEFARRFHQAGFNLHIHAIGDRGVRTAVDAIEAARAANGVSSTHDGLAHVQLANPADVDRIGRDRLYVAITYAWAVTDPAYDMTVVPFIDRMIGNGYPALHRPDGYYELNAYPARSIKAAGGILAAGSDAPVDTRDPRPFLNISCAITRHAPGQPALNSAQGISITDVIDAYTINGARMLGWDKETGSLEVGKSADFIVLDRDIIKLAATGKADEIAKTRVLETWFKGRVVYTAK